MPDQAFVSFQKREVVRGKCAIIVNGKIRQPYLFLGNIQIKRNYDTVFAPQAIENSLDECMALMNENHIRHLPVVENSIVEGVITIMDVIKNILLEKEIVIEQLEEYISGSG